MSDNQDLAHRIAGYEALRSDLLGRAEYFIGMLGCGPVRAREVAVSITDAVLPPGYKPGGETSADDEAFVAELATSLVLLIARWRERADTYERAASDPRTGPYMVDKGATVYVHRECAAELEAVLRSAT